jgi:archaellum component FlaF (FlaF/FlaG flagellin family)
MKISKLALALTTFAIGIASAASNYSITIATVTHVGQTELKPGDYKVTVEGDKVTFKNGKDTVEVPATVEKGAKKYPVTLMDSSGAQLQDIELGGTTMKLVFKPSSAPIAVGAGNGQ